MSAPQGFVGCRARHCEGTPCRIPSDGVREDVLEEVLVFGLVLPALSAVVFAAFSAVGLVVFTWLLGLVVRGNGSDFEWLNVAAGEDDEDDAVAIPSLAVVAEEDDVDGVNGGMRRRIFASPATGTSLDSPLSRLVLRLPALLLLLLVIPG